MYADYWNLARLPFENACDPDFFFRGRSHEAALLKLQYVIEQSKGVALLVGEHGLGKTCVSRVLEAELPQTEGTSSQRSVWPVVRLMFPRLSCDEMLAYLADGLVSPTEDREPTGGDVVKRLEATLAAESQAGRRPVFVIDDAHLIESPAVLQSLAQVLSLCEVRRWPLSILLLGQPELLAQVQRVPALNSRVSVRTALHPFDVQETADYVRHRMSVAGLSESLFDEDALASFHRHSLGVPRRINQLCDLALLVGYADELPTLSRPDVDAVAEELVSVTVD